MASAPKPKTKIIEVDDQRYLIRRVDPTVGGFILTRMLSAGLNSIPADSASTSKGQLLGMLVTFMHSLDFEAFSFIQNNCLAVVSKLIRMPGITEETPMPITTSEGVWAAPEVAEDLSLVMNLSVQSLVFNISDFFDLTALLDAVMKPPATTSPNMKA